MKYFKLFATTALLALGSCSGGGGDTAPTVTTTTAVTPPPPPPPPPPVTQILDNCEGLDFLGISSASDGGSGDAGFGASNVIDNNLTAASRWSSQNNGASLTLDLDGPRLVRDIGLAFFQGDQRQTSFNVSVSLDGSEFTDILLTTESSGESLSFERFDVPDTPANFVRITGEGNSINNETAIVEAAVIGCSLDPEPAQTLTVAPFEASSFGLDPNLPPSGNFDLLTWSIDTPADLNNDGRADRVPERDVGNGFVNDFFFTNDDGGMVFLSTIDGAPTSTNTRFNRSELREQLRRGNTNVSTRGVNQNNWVLGYQPPVTQNIGGRNGVLKGTLVINNVTSTGDRDQVGRTIIGQIHAENDEPMRVYYRKYPENERGIIYFAHEIRDSDDLWSVSYTHLTLPTICSV